MLEMKTFQFNVLDNTHRNALPCSVGVFWSVPCVATEPNRIQLSRGMTFERRDWMSSTTSGDQYVRKMLQVEVLEPDFLAREAVARQKDEYEYRWSTSDDDEL